MWHKHAGALCCSSEIKRARRRERASDFPTADVLRVSLWLIISYQSFNLGARSERFKPWKQLALCSPTVRVSFAVYDGNIKPVSREWTSQSESPQLSWGTSRPPTGNSCDIHSHYEHTEPSLCSPSPPGSNAQHQGHIKLSNWVKLEIKCTLVISWTRTSLWYAIVQ